MYTYVIIDITFASSVGFPTLVRLTLTSRHDIVVFMVCSRANHSGLQTAPKI